MSRPVPAPDGPFPGPDATLASMALGATVEEQYGLAKSRTPRSHAAEVASEASRLIYAKYLAGQAEHGGELWRKRGLIDHAIEEAIDQIVYLLTLREQLAGLPLGDLSE